MNKENVTGAAYIRVSTDEQTELSPDAQVRVILEAAKKEGVRIPPEYVFIEDRGRSGRRADNRPAFQRMIATARQNPPPFQYLYVWKFSRFARNQEESVFYKGILRKKCGITVISVSEPIMDGMFGRLVETIIEWSDEFYSVNLSGEVLRGMTQKAIKKGYQTTPSLGYDAVGGGKPFVINEEQYRIVEFIHQSFFEGNDMLQIARAANALGYRTRRGNLFDVRAVRLVLTNRFYVGTVTWKDITFQGTHECRESVTSIFTANQKRLQNEYRPKSRRETSSCRHWLSGILKCSACGASLGFHRSDNAKNAKRHPDSFQCWKYARGIHPDSCFLSARKAEEAAMESLRMIADASQGEYLPIKAGMPDCSEKKAAVQSAFRRLEQKELRIREAFESGIDTMEEFKKNKLRLQKEREHLQNEAHKFVGESEAGSAPERDQLPKHIQNVCELFQSPGISMEAKGNALRRVLQKAVYNSQTKTMEFYYYIR